MLSIHPVGAVDDRLGNTAGWELSMPRLARTEHVQADPRDDCRQPRAEVVDLALVSPADPDSGFLDGVLSLRGRAEHPKGDPAQPAAVGLESLCEQPLCVHSVTFLRSGVSPH